MYISSELDLGMFIADIEDYSTEELLDMLDEYTILEQDMLEEGNYFAADIYNDVARIAAKEIRYRTD